MFNKAHKKAIVKALLTPKTNKTIRYNTKTTNSCNTIPIKYLLNKFFVFLIEDKILVSCLFGKMLLIPETIKFLSFRKKKVMNNTDINPIPKSLMVPIRIFRKLGIDL